LKAARAEYAEHRAPCHALDGSARNRFEANFYPPVAKLTRGVQQLSDSEIYFIIAREHLLEIEARIRELRLLRKELQLVLRQSAPARRDADVCPMMEEAAVSATNGRSSGVRPRPEKSR
jgi:hypothetical protein